MNLILTGAAVARNAVRQSLESGAGLTSRPGPGPRSETVSGMQVTDTLRAALSSACAAHHVDFALLAPGLRLKDFRLLVLDMDSTLITIECIDELAAEAGVKAEVAALTERAMQGLIPDYAESLRQRVALLAGLPESALEKVYRERLGLTPGALELLAGARRAGLAVLVASGGFSYFLERLKTRLELDEVRANTLEIAAGRLTGRLVGPIIDGAAKADAVREVCAARGISTSQAIVVGDGANDLKMMALAGLSVAYHAKPIVAEATHVAIRYGGLDTLLEWLEWLES